MLLECKGVEKSFGEKKVLKQINFELEEGRIVADNAAGGGNI